MDDKKVLIEELSTIGLSSKEFENLIKRYKKIELKKGDFLISGFIRCITSILILFWMKYKSVNRTFLLGWNVLGLIFILFILSNGFLSQEMFYKNFGYSVPNTAIAYFPIILLGGVIVPIVIYTHLSDIILLSKKYPNEKYFYKRSNE